MSYCMYVWCCYKEGMRSFCLCDCGVENAYFELWESWLNFMK